MNSSRTVSGAWRSSSSNSSTDIKDRRYRHTEKLPFGAAVQLPDPVNITLDTEPLKEFAD
ncbi:hypothetical protein GA0115233_10449 [Streptomyces sp. DI166]|nr:hypothetical protein GA0115233_10449 [Streptomyces sp. DI166]